uniref:Uncharacterized protein n=1 Tax=viral metagenome TaxID=1070528 RepID=A0A6M3J8C9_9ZZZZ
MASNEQVDPLAEMDQAYQDAEAPEYGGAVPDGTYVARVVDADVTESRSSGNLLLKWELEVLVGHMIGRKIWKNNVIAKSDGQGGYVPDEGVKYLKGDLARVGIVLDSLPSLRQRKEELKGKVVEVSLKTKGTFQATYVNREVDDPAFKAAAPAPAGGGGVGVEGDVPF